MKKVIAILLILSAVIALASCSLIRKATSDSDGAKTADDTESSESYATDFSDTLPDNTSDQPVRYSEDQAYELLTHSFPDYDMDYVKIERTGAIVAENDGTEYYVFNVSLPKPVETEATKEGDEDETESETKAVEMEPPVPYYVSVNGVVHKEIADGNVDTLYVLETFRKKYGDTDKDTGYAYKLEYKGLLQSKDNLCYNYAVYKVNTSGAEATNEYAFNYLVTVDGKLNAESVMDN